eukprot:Blabericola_migrator_1__10251@NODE_573_length_7510_cov_308_719602_g427_i0_p2_GENE_NODE_573_length_7510_cov_308_719602_g427_i0NODE_573_length_7510_cov_308_719602_g427_i0_p2_ORF_typecomplete_len555_score75_61FOG_N/PF15888_5/87FOG_N/PF15888_5/2_3e03FOG_N/PF15888_5/33FOG_N/PF15888_5/16FOG_N/PF15888_5/3_6e02FOG_N/PF15888_5/0_64FOG_N/PF15888_5/8_3e02FOG_N/PF15888_5/6_3e02FOG_N/PF15888_5/1_5e02FOG_N/PF15888_5/69FOG_N/PF15888_5/19FOG_N/PF15888_5/5_2e02FOG_N/PF15888_5/68TIL/PF01826_17/6_1e02TIL/PF01826_1
MNSLFIIAAFCIAVARGEEDVHSQECSGNACTVQEQPRSDPRSDFRSDPLPVRPGLLPFLANGNAPPLGSSSVLHGVVKGGPERIYPDTVPPNLICPEQYEQQGRACVRVVYADQLSFCPDAFTIEDGSNTCSLRKRKPAKLSCPEGTVFKNGKCETFDILPPVNVCEPGWSLEDGQCVKLGAIQARTTCPDGFKPTKAGCIATTKINADLRCPHNFELVGKRCESWVYEKPIRECPAGYVLLNDFCVKESKQQPQFQCPRGLKAQQSDEVCYQETVLKPVYRCGQGEAKGKLCEFTLTQPPKYNCPPGYERSDNRCVKIVEQPLVPFCDQGFKLDESEVSCVRVFTQKADVACPDGTLTKNGNCVVTTTSTAEAYCPRGYSLDKGICVQALQRSPIERCPKGYKPTYRDECEMIVAVTPEIMCPTGFIARGGVCEASEITASVAVCEDGTVASPDGRCRRLELKIPKHECPQGFSINRSGDCVKITTVLGVHYCDEGAVIGDECEVATVIPALAECPKGYIGTAGRCEKTEVLEAKLECPRKYKLKNGLCVKM